MLRFALFSVLLAVACAVPISDDSDTFNIVGTSVDEFRAANPHMDLIEMEEVENFNHPGNVSSTYTWGKRQKIDKLIASLYAQQELEEPGPLVNQWVYPVPGGDFPRTVHYISATFWRSTKEGKVYLASGGVGYKNFTVIAETNYTEYYSFDGKAFGY